MNNYAPRVDRLSPIKSMIACGRLGWNSYLVRIKGETLAEFRLIAIFSKIHSYLAARKQEFILTL